MFWYDCVLTLTKNGVDKSEIREFNIAPHSFKLELSILSYLTMTWSLWISKSIFRPLRLSSVVLSCPALTCVFQNCVRFHKNVQSVQAFLFVIEQSSLRLHKAELYISRFSLLFPVVWILNLQETLTQILRHARIIVVFIFESFSSTNPWWVIRMNQTCKRTSSYDLITAIIWISTEMWYVSS